MATLSIGRIIGESSARGYEGEIDVRAWSWEVGQEDVRDGSPVVGDLLITKALDKASAELVMLACDGRAVPEAVLTVLGRGISAETVLLRIRLQEVRIRSVSLVDNEEGQPMETIRLGFAEFTMEYIEQTAAGRPGATTFKSWRIADEPEATPEIPEESW